MKYKRKKIQLLLMLSSFILFSACEYNYIKVDLEPVPDNVSFATKIQPIFNSNCACHNTGSPKPDLSEANAYASLWAEGMIDTAQPDASILYVKLEGPGSHDGRSTPNDRSLILGWITQGAKDN